MSMIDTLAQAAARLNIENERMKAALREIAALQPEKPNAADYPSGSRGHAGYVAARVTWRIAQIARAALPQEATNADPQP